MAESSSIRRTCRTRQPTPVHVWWSRPWTAPPFGWLVTRGAPVAATIGAVVGTCLLFLTVGSGGGAGPLGLILLLAIGLIVGGAALLAVVTTLVSTPVAIVLVSVRGSRRLALVLAESVAVAESTIAVVVVGAFPTGSFVPNAATAAVAYIVGVGAITATRALVIRSATRPRP